MVGYNYVRNPAFVHARRLVADGAIGRVVHFRGFVDEDYQADPELRLDLAGADRRRRGSGRSGISGATWSAWPAGCVGPIESLVADMATVHRDPAAAGRERAGGGSRTRTWRARWCGSRAG